MSFVKTPLVRFVAWSLTFAVLANGPMLTAEQRVSGAQGHENSGPEPLIQDVKLQTGGILTARIVNAQGNPVAGEQVSILFQGKEVAAVVSDADGFATVSGLRPGLHAISTPTGMSACRLWNADTAPPASASVPAVVSDAEVIRGQFGAFNLPMVVVLAAAAAGIILAVDAKNTASDAEDANAALAARVKALETASP
ncbi:MAG: carboxypeptidase regulatory-like domain-containing protein [Planctomycetaceae bacterium]|nr:carboxypeptidase regulatory-like domain-containing protein [Planctomycetaceae bacterium]